MKTKLIEKLTNGDIIDGNKGALHIISNDKGLLFCYNEKTGLFETHNLKRNYNNGDAVYILN